MSEQEEATSREKEEEPKWIHHRVDQLPVEERKALLHALLRVAPELSEQEEMNPYTKPWSKVVPSFEGAEEEEALPDKVRYSVNLSPRLYAVLEGLATETGRPKSEVVRQAIALIKYAADAQRSGKHFGIAESSDQLSTELLTFW